jgi:K+/H+ antiporter YhaU regulatory subunit KhtT
MQEYNQDDLLAMAQTAMGKYFYNLCFQYIPEKNDARAALNFHLTKSEKKDIAAALGSESNQETFEMLNQLMHNSRAPLTAINQKSEAGNIK